MRGFKDNEKLSELRPSAVEKRLFTDVRSGSIVVMKRGIVEDVLEKRLTKTSGNDRYGVITIDDLFMIVPAPRNNYGVQEEGEDLVETKFGKLRVFFVKGITRSSILHRKKYPYPKISRVSVH